MKLKLLIATSDSDYSEYLSNVLSERYADTFEVSVCSSAERLPGLLVNSRFDAALIEPDFALEGNISSIRLPLMLMDETDAVIECDIKTTRKYQRISSIAGSVLEHYAELGKGTGNFDSGTVHVTAVWSPTGGSGKTITALAYASQRVSNGKRAIYFNMENFSSTAAFFQESGKSISKAFEKLESNIRMFMAGIRQQDSGSGISFFCGPENYDDMNILTPDDIAALVNACAAETDELVIDLSSQCDERTRKVFDLADTVFIVTDPSNISQMKLKQFISQHNVFEQIQSRSVLINNKGAATAIDDVPRTVYLPLVQSGDPVSVYKTLSSVNFEQT